MDTLINAIREVLGTPTFWTEFETNNSYSSWNWNYGAMLEYMIAGILLCVVVSSVFKFIRCLLK